MEGYVLNPNDEVVKYIKTQVRENNGYCICCEEHSKATKCPKACKKSKHCPCGMYIPDDYEPDEFNLD